MRKLAALAVLAAAAVGLARYGRARVRDELAPFGATDAGTVADSMPFKDAVLAGARALAGRTAFGTQATVTIAPN